MRSDGMKNKIEQKHVYFLLGLIVIPILLHSSNRIMRMYILFVGYIICQRSIWSIWYLIYVSNIYMCIYIYFFFFTAPNLYTMFYAYGHSWIFPDNMICISIHSVSFIRGCQDLCGKKTDGCWQVHIQGWPVKTSASLDHNMLEAGSGQIYTRGISKLQELKPKFTGEPWFPVSVLSWSWIKRTTGWK